MVVKYKASIKGIAKANHPDCASKTPLEYSDTYTIDTDYFNGYENINHYIKHDLWLVIGGGYSTDTVENVQFTIEAV